MQQQQQQKNKANESTRSVPQVQHTKQDDGSKMKNQCGKNGQIEVKQAYLILMFN